MAVGLAFAPAGVTVGEAPPPPPPPGPDSVTGLYAWYAASDLGLSDNDPIGSWADASGNGNTLTQGTGGAKPTYKAAILNSEAVARFDGGDVLNTATFGAALAHPNTYFLVAQAVPVLGVNQAFFDGILHPDRNLFRFSQTTSLTLYAGNAYNSLSQVPDSSWHIYCVLFNGSSSRIRIDGGAGVTGLDPSTNALGGLRVGSNAGLDESLTGDIAELILYDVLPSDSDLNVVGNYLEDKYGLTWTDI